VGPVGRGREVKTMKNARRHDMCVLWSVYVSGRREKSIKNIEIERIGKFKTNEKWMPKNDLLTLFFRPIVARLLSRQTWSWINVKLTISAHEISTGHIFGIFHLIFRIFRPQSSKPPFRRSAWLHHLPDYYNFFVRGQVTRIYNKFHETFFGVLTDFIPTPPLPSYTR